ncbi:MAG: tRNA (adenosine(37)-N6)-threonylcarbamoyltransferase complex dimerization subunit type 1 TsaB [Candidatus Eremiobacteraeota bacterium]|nr:tRNA (adenosine(37)-N6)-threonylcarbamoyltransferase complex dimerization subunit type 1 TsaB [Candidatus Eremiobacteraeota bacterium]
MKVLALDGALRGFSAAVTVDAALVAVRNTGGNDALEAGLSTIAQTLRDAGIEPAQLDRLAVGVGPGGFTGLRIAISYAKSLALAWNRPLVAVSSFDILEYGRRLEQVLTIVEGRPGVISARYRDRLHVRRASGRTRDAFDAILPRDVPELDVVGAAEDALAALAERGTVVHCLEPLVTPAAAAAALVAGTRQPASSLHEVVADYGELPAAKVPKL